MATKKKDVKEKTNITEELEQELKEKNSIANVLELIAIVLFVIVTLVFFPNTVVWNIVVLLLMLSVLIFVHELGHFIMAKLFKVHVYEFAIGMGPLVFSFRRKNDPTLYSLRALPIGGYNSIAGESYDDDDNLPKESKMCYKPKWQRLLILVAGVTMNFILAFIVLFFIGLGGVPSQDNVITAVESGSPAEMAGLKSGDQILKLNNHKVDTWYYLSIVSLLKNNNEYYSYEVKHADGAIETINIKPLEVIQDENGNIYNITEENKEEDIIKEHNFKEGEYTKTKIIGIRGSDKNEYGIRNALKYAFKRFVTISRSMYLIIGSLFTGALSLDALSGPVGMYSVVEKVGHTGFANIAYLAAYLSINLGIMNILPFPAFDGGHVLFVLIELITRKRVNEKFEAVCHFIGFILIFTLMILITFKDVIRLIG